MNEQNIEEQFHESEYLEELLKWAYSKLVYRSFDRMEDALQMDRIKLWLEHRKPA